MRGRRQSTHGRRQSTHGHPGILSCTFNTLAAKGNKVLYSPCWRQAWTPRRLLIPVSGHQWPTSRDPTQQTVSKRQTHSVPQLLQVTNGCGAWRQPSISEGCTLKGHLRKVKTSTWTGSSCMCHLGQAAVAVAAGAPQLQPQRNDELVALGVRV